MSYLIYMTHNCADDCCNDGSDFNISFSEETQKAIEEYNTFLKEYSLSDEFSAENLFSARMQTVYGESDNCCGTEANDSPMDLFIQKLLLNANNNKQLTDDDIRIISEKVSKVDELAFKDLINVVKEMQETGVIKENEDKDNVEEIPSPFM